MPLRMLVTLDGSEFSEGIIDHAASLARQSVAEVILLRVVGPAHDRGLAARNYEATGERSGFTLAGGPDPGIRVRGIESATQAAERLAADARDYLAPLCRRLEGLAVEYLVRHGANVAREILRCAEEQRVDLIAMAMHSRRGVPLAVVGRVAEDVVRAGTLPVLLFHPEASNRPGRRESGKVADQ